MNNVYVTVMVINSRYLLYVCNWTNSVLDIVLFTYLCFATLC